MSEGYAQIASAGAACARKELLPQLLIKTCLLEVLNGSVGKAVQMSALILFRQKKEKKKKISWDS